MSKEQIEKLREVLDEAEAGRIQVEQIHFLAGGNISENELTTVTVMKNGTYNPESKPPMPSSTYAWRDIDIYDTDGNLKSTKTAHLTEAAAV